MGISASMEIQRHAASMFVQKISTLQTKGLNYVHQNETGSICIKTELALELTWFQTDLLQLYNFLWYKQCGYHSSTQYQCLFFQFKNLAWVHLQAIAINIRQNTV